MKSGACEKRICTRAKDTSGRAQWALDGRMDLVDLGSQSNIR